MEPTLCFPIVQVNIKLIKKTRCPLDVPGQNDTLQILKYITNCSNQITYTLIIYKSNFKNSKHVAENDKYFKISFIGLRRYCLILLSVPPCFIILDIMLAHLDLTFSSSVVVLVILRISVPRETYP